MKWHERHAHTIELALICLVGLAMLALFLLLLIVPARSHAAACLTIDLQPSDVMGNYDGDTYMVRLGPFGAWSIREDGIDTPERSKKQPGWKEAKAFTESWLHEGPFQLRTCFVLTLGRVVGVTSRHGIALSDALRAAGHEKPQ